MLVPPVTPETTPEEEPMFTTDVLLLVQVPDGVRSPKVVVVSAQRLPPLVIGLMAGATVSVLVAKQPATE